MTTTKLKALLPYSTPFLFVDEFLEVDENSISGTYQYREEEYFYAGHFPDNPVTPGVILIETMAQIGLVGLGMYLTNAHEEPESRQFVFTTSEVDFLKVVLPGDKVVVYSEKVYFRFGKLKCKVKMTNNLGETVCKGTMSGMIVKANQNEK